VDQILRVVAKPTHQKILFLVWNKERSAGEIAHHFPVTFGAVSQHLALLREADLVQVRKDGRQRFYRANRQALGPLAAYLEGIWRAHLDELRVLAEAAEQN
jgi:DNA-binding transcriptional ArsR family regulator